MPLPWADRDRYPDERGTASQRVRAVQRNFESRHGPPDPLLGESFSFAIAPDREWSDEKVRRIIIARRSAGSFSGYEMLEFSLPPDLDALVAFAGAFFDAPDGLSSFEMYLSDVRPWRDFFVCTHGSTDICCGLQGAPIYQQLRASARGSRAWRTMHIQGHRFAPTLWELPAGNEWAFLDGASTDELLLRNMPTSALARHLRGCSAFPSPLQVLDREGFVREGWQWFDYQRAGRILDMDAQKRTWHARLDFQSPDGDAGFYEGLVKVRRDLADTGCGNDMLRNPGKASPEYGLEGFVEHRS
jgi:hypothetical protein